MNTTTMIFLALVIWTHFVADFILQSRDVARNKSNSNIVLAQHVLIYGIPLLIVFGPWYALVNVILHFITDYITSRATKKAWAEKKEHKFFTIIGADQAVHMTCLVLTAPLCYWL